jgi:hypothetical protein
MVAVHMQRRAWVHLGHQEPLDAVTQAATPKASASRIERLSELRRAQERDFDALSAHG